MRNLNLKTLTFTSSLLAVTIALVTAQGCSTGSDTPMQTGAAGTGSPSGAAGTGSGSGAAGTGSGSGAAGTNASGAAGTGSGSGVAGASGAAGTGVSSTGAAGEAPPTTGLCAGMGTRKLGLDQSKVENFEDATLSPAWATFNDVTPANSVKMTLDAGGAAGTAHAGHYTGTGAKTPAMMGYGVGAIYNTAIDHTAMIFCVDVTAFDGVTFWAKGKAGTHLGVNFVIPQTNMAPEGDCTTGCYNHPQKTISLTAEWAQYTVPFSAAVAGTNKVNGRIQELGWLSPEADWDYYIDEIQFYKGTAPTGPAM